MVKAAGFRAGENIEALPGLIALADDVDQAIRNAVTKLRAEQDYSWAAFGHQAGITRQSGAGAMGDAVRPDPPRLRPRRAVPS